jgi:glycosyltransferase involved in cell wall biosynthesis
MENNQGNRFKLGVLFYFDTSWMGGVIYVQNIIRTLNFLDDSDKPEILLFYRKELNRFVEELEYPYLQKIEMSFPNLAQRYMHSWFKSENYFIENILNNYEVNALFPMHDFPIKSKLAKEKNVKLICWFADLQYKYYPEFFSWKKRFFTSFRLYFVFRNCKHLLVSSKSVENDFNKFFDIRDVKIKVFHFVSIIGAYKQDNLTELILKYKLPQKYFIVSNQFHKHKNHKLIIQAMALLKEKKFKIHVAFTGKMPFDQKAPHILELNELIQKNDLLDQITFLGLMPRDEQLLLMKNAQAVIQPSFFEGWSTVNEDAMALNVPVISSNIPVNIEQLGSTAQYFDPKDEMELSRILQNFPDRDFEKKIYGNYDERIKVAAIDFINYMKS